jgi:mRNA interferase MazF
MCTPQLKQVRLLATSSPSGPYCPDVGDIIRLNFDPQAGREQAGARPAIVLSPHRYNSYTRLCVLCPITNQIKGYPFEVLLPAGFLVTGAILCDQVKSLSWEQRSATFLEVAPAVTVADVRAKIKALLQIP